MSEVERVDLPLFASLHRGPGREPATLHVGYEFVALYPLPITGEPDPRVVGEAEYEWFRVDKMRFSGKGTAKDRSIVVYNAHRRIRHPR